MSGASWSARLRQATAEQWDAVLMHPFLAGMGDGTLPAAAFRRYMVQDYLFLMTYARVLAVATAKAAELPAMGRLAELVNATLNVEMGLHRGFAARVGIPPAELEGAAMLPPCEAYTSHLLAVAWAEPVAVIAASLLPCQLGYAEIGRHLFEQRMPRISEYAEWVEMYASDEYVSLARWLAEHADELAAAAGSRELARMDSVYRRSLACEHGFWDMAFGSTVGPG